MNTSVDFVFDIAKLEGWSDNIMSVGFAEKEKIKILFNFFSNLLYVSAKSENRKRITTNKTWL